LSVGTYVFTLLSSGSRLRQNEHVLKSSDRVPQNCSNIAILSQEYQVGTGTYRNVERYGVCKSLNHNSVEERHTVYLPTYKIIL